MTIKLILLRTGETIISDVSEMVIGDENTKKIIGYSLSYPCGIVVEDVGEDNTIDLTENKTKLSIRLVNWIPLSKENKIPIVCDWVVSLMDPVDDLRQTYEETVLIRN